LENIISTTNLTHGFDRVMSRREWHQEMKNKTPKPVPDSIKVRPPWKPFQDHARIWLNSATLPGPYYDQDSYTSFFTRQACEFIDQNKTNRFCLWLGYTEPHSPFNFPLDFEGKYRPEDTPLPQGSSEDNQWIPEVFADLTESEKRGIIASYYTSVEYLDSNIGVVLEKLKDLGLDKNTLVIYIGDHGYLLNDHKRFEKHMMWEQAVNSPLIVRMEGLDSGSVSNVLTGYVDLVPTILGLLKIDPMPGLQGRSLLPVLTQSEEDHKEYVFSEFLADNKAMIRSKSWKYIYSSGKRDLAQGYATGNPATGPIHRLYDLRNDPGETTNVFNEPANQKILTDLQDEMLRTFFETHPKITELPSGLNKEEMLSWFCEPPEGENVKAQ
jgi:choline-sulfatase